MMTNKKLASSPVANGINNHDDAAATLKKPRADSIVDADKNGDVAGDSRPVRYLDYRQPNSALSLEDFDAIQYLKAEVFDLRAKLEQSSLQAAANLSNMGYDPGFATSLPPLLEDPQVKRRSTTPMLNRSKWVGYKNLYLEEPVYTIDVLMGLPKFYWQRRAEERETRDRLETARTYSAEEKLKALEKDREESGFDVNTNTTKGARPNGKEMPERIRINSQPLLAILSDIADESWGDEPKVMLRPYKLLVAHEGEIRKRLHMLQQLWTERQQQDGPTDFTPLFQPETLDDAIPEGDDDEESFFRGHHSIITSSSHERRVRRRLDHTTTHEALTDLTNLVEFLDVDVMPVVRQYLPNSPTAHSKIHFRDLWYLYRPGEWVVLDARRGKRYSPHAGSQQPSSQPGNIGDKNFSLWRVLRTANGRPKLSPPQRSERNRQPACEIDPFTVRCYRIDFDGDRFGPIWVDFDFQPWEGERSIEQLEIVPLRLTKEPEATKQRFVERGEKFMSLRTPQHRIYSGPLVNHHPSGLVYEHRAPGQRDVHGSVIIDFKEAARMHPDMVHKLGFADSFLEYDDNDLTLNEDYPVYAWEDRKTGVWKERIDEIWDDTPVDERMRHELVRKDPFLSQYDSLMQGDYISGDQFGKDECALLTGRVCAYILQRRQFALLKLEHLREQSSSTQNWDDLHLHPDNKETVKAQTMSHFRNKALRKQDRELQFDLSQEKGLGLIVLLHGVPGVGKTSTAECVAQLLGKPLFPITCGDLGTNAGEVEAQLNEIFNKAEKWDCVLLLDEADVFLTSRDKGDLHRNAVVSVFLRILELYTGILFLTTNRIGVLDEAFMSRCHTQLYYPPLNEEQSVKIWDTNLRKLQRRKQQTLHVAIDGILHFAREHFQRNRTMSTRWNGRQIRNACQAAAALAEHDAYGMNDHCPSPSHQPSHSGARLDVDHFRRVDLAMREFHAYMCDVHGEDFAGTARARGEREDDFQTRHPAHEAGYGPSPTARQLEDGFPAFSGSGAGQQAYPNGPENSSRGWDSRSSFSVAPHRSSFNGGLDRPFGGGQERSGWRQY